MTSGVLSKRPSLPTNNSADSRKAVMDAMETLHYATVQYETAVSRVEEQNKKRLAEDCRRADSAARIAVMTAEAQRKADDDEQLLQQFSATAEELRGATGGLYTTYITMAKELQAAQAQCAEQQRALSEAQTAGEQLRGELARVIAQSRTEVEQLERQLAIVNWECERLEESNGILRARGAVVSS